MEDILKFDIPIYQSSYIKVIGVGGGGSNAVNHMFEHGIKGVDFIVCNTDASALDNSRVPNKIQLGKGLGAGNIPAVAERAANEKSAEIKSVFESNTQMAFITAGMGGGTGTGAAPVVAKLLKEIELEDEEVKNILTVAVVTTPFAIEGRKRMQQAQDGIAELRKYVDAILIINNDKLNEYGELKMSEAFALANEILTTAVKGISEIMTVESKIHIDFRDVNTVMRDSGVALMGIGSAEGEDRAIKAISQAITSPLLNDNDIKGAKNVLLYISSSSENEATMSEFQEITNFVQKVTGREMDMIWGQGFDDSLGEKISITLVATGFSEKELYSDKEAERIDLETGNKTSLEKRSLNESYADGKQPDFVFAPHSESNPQADEPFTVRQIEKASPDSTTNSLEQSLNRLEQEQIFATNDSVSGIRIKSTIPNLSVKNDSSSTPPVERFQELSAERTEHLRKLSERVKSADGLETVERTPAYISRGVNMEPVAHSSTTQASRLKFNEEGKLVENGFLNDNVD